MELQVLTRGRTRRNSPRDAGKRVDEINPADNTVENPANETAHAKESLSTPEDTTNQLQRNEGEEDEANTEVNRQEKGG